MMSQTIMKMRCLMFTVTAITMTLAGCSVESDGQTDKKSTASIGATAETSRQLTFAAVGEYIVPGAAHLARSKGFTKCEDTHYALVCTHPKPPHFFGVPVLVAQVQMDRGNHLAIEPEPENSGAGNIKGATLDDLSYASIDLTFSPQQFDDACIERVAKESWERPAECAMPGTVEAAVHAMRAEGWVLVHDRKGNRTWMHPETAAEISSSGIGPDDMLKLSKANLQEVRSTLEEHTAELVKIEKESAAAQALVDQMKAE